GGGGLAAGRRSTRGGARGRRDTVAGNGRGGGKDERTEGQRGTARPRRRTRRRARVGPHHRSPRDHEYRAAAETAGPARGTREGDPRVRGLRTGDRLGALDR